MSKFLYLFRNEDRGMNTASPEQIERHMKSWLSWIEELRGQGHLVATGERLDAKGKQLRGKAKTIIDGPYAEAKDIIGGYLLIQARDLEQAVELAKGCPIFERDGSVEVRPVISP